MRQELEAHGYRVADLAQPGAAERVNLTDTTAVRSAVQRLQPDYVVHLAAIAFVGHNDANAFYTTNLLGTRNLLNALAELSSPPKRVLLASSANIYGNTTEGLISESTPPNPANDYAVSKLAMEYMARLFSSKLSLTIARPFNYTGVGQSVNFLIPKIVNHFRERQPAIELGNLDVWRDFGDVRAVVQAYRQLLEAPAAAGKTVNVASGTVHALRDVVNLCTELTQHQPELRTNPAFVRANDVKILQGDNTRLHQLIGQWEPPAFKETLRWMLNN